jgi:hypothetical protein
MDGEGDALREEEHTANTALCTLCSRAQALISEVYRLKVRSLPILYRFSTAFPLSARYPSLQDRLPNVFYPEENPKFGGVLFDFRYLKVRDALHL